MSKAKRLVLFLIVLLITTSLHCDLVYGAVSEGTMTYCDWSKGEKSGTHYDSGDDPSIAITKAGIVIECHENGSGKLYYRLGSLADDGSVEWATNGGTYYDNGYSPSIAVTDDGTIIEVHGDYSWLKWKLFYRIGKLSSDAQSIEWVTSGGTNYDTGKRPCVEVLENGRILEFHDNGSGKLFYKIGMLEDDRIDWVQSGGTYYDNGYSPSIAVMGNTIIEVHDNGGLKLYYKIGYLSDNGEAIYWVQSGGTYYDSGKRPVIALTANNQLLEFHDDGSGDLYYYVGTLINDQIQWQDRGGIRNDYDTGNTPSIAIGDDGTIVEVHNNGAYELYYNTGKVRTTDGYSNWMETLYQQYPEFGEAVLRDVLLPGTHDTGTFTFDDEGDPHDLAPDSFYPGSTEYNAAYAIRDMIVPFSQTQDLDVKQQLEVGVRYFDLRVGPYMVYENGEVNIDETDLRTMHGIYGEGMDTIVDEVSQFINQNTQEIVILDFQHFYEMTDTSYQYLVNQLTSTFSEQLISLTELKSSTLEELWNSDKHIVILFTENEGSGAYIDNELILSRQSSLINTYNSDNLDITAFSSLLDEYLNTAEDELLFVLQGVRTPAFDIGAILDGMTLYELSEETNPVVLNWLEDNYDKTGNKGGGNNIIMLDYMDYKTIEKIINFNIAKWK
ncbi:phosphatidylinositol-specific phospholipase C domain-containing protein [Vallitalea okinawensis]|uniref:phosphatidylinositol-specific phospholipase C domain-containing protein n=1 Tax=Vallitalea okinawensis TaxID=2078660 RepID=UPI0013008C48|nr:phosphatidylinositol-specific phospholipase C domain-containing protein [Vallitalea okinawensis]